MTVYKTTVLSSGFSRVDPELKQLYASYSQACASPVTHEQFLRDCQNETLQRLMGVVVAQVDPLEAVAAQEEARAVARKQASEEDAAYRELLVEALLGGLPFRELSEVVPLNGPAVLKWCEASGKFSGEELARLSREVDEWREGAPERAKAASQAKSLKLAGAK